MVEHRPLRTMQHCPPVHEEPTEQLVHVWPRVPQAEDVCGVDDVPRQTAVPRLFSQHPLHELPVQTQRPLTSSSPSPQTHCPARHVPPRQARHASPSVPHAVAPPFSRQVPSLEQHPVAHVSRLHTQVSQPGSATRRSRRRGARRLADGAR